MRCCTPLQQIYYFKKRMSVDFSPSFVVSTFFFRLNFKRSCSNEQLTEVISRFNSQTYYDQFVICGLCERYFMKTIEKFLEELETGLRIRNGNNSPSLPAFPTYDSLDMLCEMMEVCLTGNKRFIRHK